MTSRPRRSIQPSSSYFIQPLNEDLSNTSDSDQPQQQLQQRDIEVDSDISEYAPDDSDHNKVQLDKGKGKQEDSSSSDDQTEDEEQGDDDDTIQEKDDDSDNDVINSSDEDESDLGSGNNRKITVKGRGKLAGSTFTPVAMAHPRIVVAGANVAAPVVTHVSTRIESAIPVKATFPIAPFFEPPSRWLSDPPTASSTILSGPPVTTELRARFTQAAMKVVFKPDPSMSQDAGWWKGKWGKEGVNPRWGGWYEEIKSKPTVDVTPTYEQQFSPSESITDFDRHSQRFETVST
jgi:hypothetical protein